MWVNTEQSLKKISKHADKKITLPEASRWFVGSPQSLLHLFIFTCEKQLAHQDSCTNQKTGLEIQCLPNPSSKLIWWVLQLF